MAVSAPVGVSEEAVEDFVRAAQRVDRRRAGTGQDGRAGRRAAGRWRTGPGLGAGGTSCGPCPGSQPGPRLRRTAVLLGGSDEEARRRGLEGLYRRELEAALPGLRAEWEPRVGRSPSLIRLRRMTTRWGTCNTRSAAITLNVALAEHPPSALEYVLVHELVHLHERGHGPGFVAWMDRLIPDWRVRRRSLHGRA